MEHGTGPRPDDHLVEPLFEALRPHAHPPEPEHPRRADRASLPLVGGLAVAALLLAWWLLS